MAKGYCDNTDCEQADEKVTLKKVTLTEEFDGDECDWCQDCVDRDEDMVEEVR